MKETDRKDYIGIVALLGMWTLTWFLVACYIFGYFGILTWLSIGLFAIFNWILGNTIKLKRKVLAFLLIELIQVIPAVIVILIRTIVVK